MRFIPSEASSQMTWAKYRIMLLRWLAAASRLQLSASKAATGLVAKVRRLVTPCQTQKEENAQIDSGPACFFSDIHNINASISYPPKSTGGGAGRSNHIYEDYTAHG